jgi:hypothetical protein
MPHWRHCRGSATLRAALYALDLRASTVRPHATEQYLRANVCAPHSAQNRLRISARRASMPRRLSAFHANEHGREQKVILSLRFGVYTRPHWRQVQVLGIPPFKLLFSRVVMVLAETLEVVPVEQKNLVSLVRDYVIHNRSRCDSAIPLTEHTQGVLCYERGSQLPPPGVIPTLAAGSALRLKRLDAGRTSADVRLAASSAVAPE